MSSYVLSAAGSSNPTLKLTAVDATGTAVTGDTGLEIDYLQNITVNNAQDIFTWTQLNQAAKLSVPSTATNSLSTTIVVDVDSFFGTTDNASVGDTAAEQGLLQMSRNKQRVKFEVNIGDTATTGKTISGFGYVTGLSPTVSSDSPVWTTPMTITADSDYTVA